MAKLNLVVHVCLVVVRPRGVSNKIWARKTFCFVTKNLGLLSILKSILNFKTLFNLILYNVECVIVHTSAKWSNIIWEGKYLI